MRPEPRPAAVVAVAAVALLAVVLGGATSSASPAAATSAAGRRTKWQRCGVPTRIPKGDIIVPVVVDFGGPAGKLLVSCVLARAGATGADVLQSQARLIGYPTPRYADSGLLCAIDGYPTAGCGTESGGHYSYWAYWHGGARWLYANDGPGEWTVSRGDVEGWRFEPDGSASPADPPPRAPSTAAALESTTSQKQAVVQASSGDRAGPVHVADSDSATKTALFGICLGLILLIGAAALFRVRRAHGRIS